MPTDPTPSPNQNITEELYKKNVDLVNANKTLELIQELYNIMISNSTVADVSQKFIDTVCAKLGFLDGIVVTLNKSNQALTIMGITQTELNKTILDRSAVQIKDVLIPLNSLENELVKAFNSKSSSTVRGISNIWTPIVKKSDIGEIVSFSQDVVFLVYPIVFGYKVIGAYAVSLPKGVEKLTEFEQNALNRLATVFGIAIDRTRINQELTETQQRELAKANELLKLKDEFVFIATHDLRTPVTAIDGYLSMIKEDRKTFTPEVEKNLEAVEEASDRLKTLVNDLLQVARSESGTIKVNVAPMDFYALSDRIIREVTPAAEAKKVKLINNVDQANKMILGDDEKLAEVVENLMSNAIKFNRPDGNITLSSKPVNGMLEISVADTGHGIPAAEQAKLFTKFFKYRGETTQDVPGTGLGLFVVRMLVEKMGGKISFTSVEEKGTTFIFTVPLVTNPVAGIPITPVKQVVS